MHSRNSKGGTAGIEDPQVQCRLLEQAENILEKFTEEWHVFRPRKATRNSPRFTMQSTTTSPRFTTTKHPKIRKPPVKTTSIPLPTFFGVQTAN
jgi:hypothetical protein